mmetsp:Transcript_49292/g.74997  ORF Transcript_49292/g.74997 Transcript_49292/m.74997 type:complete len:142 (+) Transcript_49292:32-457(+)
MRVVTAVLLIVCSPISLCGSTVLRGGSGEPAKEEDVGAVELQLAARLERLKAQRVSPRIDVQLVKASEIWEGGDENSHYAVPLCDYKADPTDLCTDELEALLQQERTEEMDCPLWGAIGDYQTGSTVEEVRRSQCGSSDEE